jgi:hypothetical protein
MGIADTNPTRHGSPCITPSQPSTRHTSNRPEHTYPTLALYPSTPALSLTSIPILPPHTAHCAAATHRSPRRRHSPLTAPPPLTAHRAAATHRSSSYSPPLTGSTAAAVIFSSLLRPTPFCRPSLLRSGSQTPALSPPLPEIQQRCHPHPLHRTRSAAPLGVAWQGAHSRLRRTVRREASKQEYRAEAGGWTGASRARLPPPHCCSLPERIKKGRHCCSLPERK